MSYHPTDLFRFSFTAPSSSAYIFETEAYFNGSYVSYRVGPDLILTLSATCPNVTVSPSVLLCNDNDSPDFVTFGLAAGETVYLNVA